MHQNNATFICNGMNGDDIERRLFGVQAREMDLSYRRNQTFGIRARVLIKMFPKRSEGEELEYPFFEDELKMGDDAFVLIGKEVAPNSEIPEAMFPLLEEFSDVFPDELPDALSPLCEI
nr:hypothetical protein [Tanacetum cinerariifolium]